MSDASTTTLTARFLSLDQAEAAVARLRTMGYRVQVEVGSAADTAGDPTAAVAPTVDWGRLPYRPDHLDDAWTPAWDGPWTPPTGTAAVTVVVPRAREVEARRLLQESGASVAPEAGRT